MWEYWMNKKIISYEFRLKDIQQIKNISLMK